MTEPLHVHRPGRWPPLAWATGLTISLLAGYAMIHAAEPTDAHTTPPASSQPGIACVRDINADDRYCERFITDLTRRAPLSPQHTQAAEAAKQSVTQALSGDVLNRCNLKHEPCNSVMAWAERPATPDHVWSRLAPLTINRPQVRRARPDDPAVADSVVFGVLIGPICVYGHQRRNKDPDHVYTAGPLPDGACLTP